MITSKTLELHRTALRNAAKKFSAVSGARRRDPQMLAGTANDLEVAARAFVEAELELNAATEIAGRVAS